MHRDAIDTALARRLVDAPFPAWRDLSLGPVADDGWDNRTFHLGTRLKGPPADRSRPSRPRSDWPPRSALPRPAPIA
jgi:hypothetical protein